MKSGRRTNQSKHSGAQCAQASAFKDVRTLLSGFGCNSPQHCGVWMLQQEDKDIALILGAMIFPSSGWLQRLEAHHSIVGKSTLNKSKDKMWKNKWLKEELLHTLAWYNANETSLFC